MSARARTVLATANIRGNPPMLQRHVREDLLQVRDAGPDLIAWQELWWPRYRRALRRNLPGFKHHAPNSDAGSCTSWNPNRFAFLSAGREQLHRGKAGVTSHRDVTWVRLTDKVTGREITHGSAHLVPKAWTVNASRRNLRMQLWTEGMARLQDFVRREVVNGRTVVLGIDGNAPRDRIRDALGHYIAGQPIWIRSHGIDHHIIVGPDVQLLESRTLDGANTDHRPFLLEVSW